MPLSTYWGNLVLDATLSGGTLPAVASVWLTVHSADPGETGASEAAGGDYAPQQVAWNAAANKLAGASAGVVFAGMPAGTWTHGALWDSADPATRNQLGRGAFAVAQTTQAGNNLTLAAEDITFGFGL